MLGTNLHIYQSPFTHESRILKESKSIVDYELAEKVIIAAVWEPGLMRHSELDEKRVVHRFPMGELPLSLGKLGRAINLLIWMFHILWSFIFCKIDVVSCRSLVVLPLGVLFKLIQGSRIIYDVHELETEKDGWGGMSQTVARVLERVLIKCVDSVVVVSDSIAQWYKKTYRLEDVFVIRNVPYYQNDDMIRSSLFKEKFAISPNDILFIFQGSLSYGRGVELLLDAFAEVGNNKHIVFMGYGELLSKVNLYQENHLNIHYQPAVKPEEIPYYTSSADAGFNIAEPTCINHLYSLPNKIFEYIGSGVPIIVSDFPDMGNLVDRYNCGWKVSVDKSLIVDLVESITLEQVTEKKEATVACRSMFDWATEAQILQSIYTKF